MWENTDQKNSEYGHFSRSVNQMKTYEGNVLKIDKKIFVERSQLVSTHFGGVVMLQ